MKKLIIFTSIIITLFYAADAYAGVIIRPVHHFGLVGYWDFQEGTGTIANDHSGQGNHGTLTNMTEDDWIDGKLGQALDFDGSNDYVEAGDTSSLSITGDLTLSAWVFPGIEPDIHGHKIIDKYSYPSNQRAYKIDIDATGGNCEGYLTFIVSSTAASFNGAVLCSDMQLSAGNWYHVVAVFDAGSSMKIYINGSDHTGEIVIGSVPASIADSTSELAIGADGNGDGPLDGIIDEVRVYNRALSAGEVERLYKLSQPRVMAPSMTGLVGYWRFDEGTGLKAGDHSGQGNHGTLASGMTEDDWVEGKYGTALDFDGDGDGISVSSNVNAINNFTVSVWASPLATGSTRRVFVAYAVGSVSTKYGIIEKLGSNNWYINFRTSGEVYTERDTGVSIQFSNWQYVVATYDGTDYKFYFNGELKYTHTNTQSSNVSASPAEIGSYNGVTDELFTGLIDEVRIYDRALTASEVETLYKSGLAKVNTSQTDKLTEGLVGMWSFDGQDIYWPTNMAVDRSGQGNHGAITNMNTSTAPTAGQVGQALEFDGSDDYVEASSASITSEITLAAWINVEILGDENLAIVWDWRDDAGGALDWSLAVRDAPDNDISFNYTSNGSYDVNKSLKSSALSAKVWTHVVGTYNGSVMKIYLDGIEDATKDASGSIYDNNPNITIGVHGDKDEYFFDGIIDEVRVYNRALSADEIKRLYNMGR